eukprot:m.1294940 g.1294940  ORF g.1294940 m.1294940 type:complete len:210 (+) comp24789_c2_seq22:242-871(+)
MDSADAIKSPRVDEVRMYKGINPKNSKAQVGTLHLTATHGIFVDTKTRQETYVLYMTIHSVKKKGVVKKGKKEYTSIEIHGKDFQILLLLIPRAIDALHVFESLNHFSFPEKLEDLYAFQYQPDYDSDVDGWKFYDVEAEYGRFRVPNDKWVLSRVNFKYELCPTYTKYIYEPASLKPSTIAGEYAVQCRSNSLIKVAVPNWPNPHLPF